MSSHPPGHRPRHRSTRRWVRGLASLAVAAAGLTTVAGVIGPASPAGACVNPDCGPSYVVVTYSGSGNYDYVYSDGRVREYRNFRFVREYYVFN
jgi:hypothetical protein